MSQTVSLPNGIPLDRGNRPFDPPSQMDELREKPLTKVSYFEQEHLGWVVTGYELAKQILADPRFSADSTKLTSPPPVPGNQEGAFPPPPRGFFIRMDAPEHTRLRRMLTGVFTVKRMKELEDRIAQIVSDHLDAMAIMERPLDLVQAFALPVPSLVICEMLGVPYDERGTFQSNTAKLVNLEYSRQERAENSERMRDFLRRLCKDKRAHPTDDLLSDLAARDDLEFEDLVGMSTLLLIAGHETTANMLGLGTFALLEHPEQWQALHDEPTLMPGAVEELMRYLSIIHLGPFRVANEDMELHGEQIHKGDSFTISSAAVNRSSEKFADPDTLDVRRRANGHVSFGHGVHQCLGQQLARIEMRLGFNGLIQRYPNLRLAVDTADVPVRDKMAIYGVHKLPVTW